MERDTLNQQLQFILMRANEDFHFISDFYDKKLLKPT